MSKRVILSHGLGDVLNPTAGSQLDCGLFAGGVFNPACWCLASGGSLCTAAAYQAARGIAYPQDLYPNLNPPPAPAPPANIVTPAAGTDPTLSQGVIDDLLIQQGNAIKQSAADSIDDSSVADTTAGCTIWGFSCTTVVVGLVGLGILLAMKDWTRS